MRNINRLRAMFKQATYDAKTNSDEQAYNTKDLYGNWEDIAEGKEIEKDTFLNYLEVLYKCLQTHNKQEAWNPKDAPSLFAKVLIPDPEVIPEWEQPSSTNPYMKGDKVKHNGYKWESLVDNNVWEPTEAVPTLWKNLGAV